MEKKKGLVFGGLLLLGIGFAAVTTTLYINGTVKIKADKSELDEKVIFASVAVDDESTTKGTTASIIENGRKIEFTTHSLKDIGEKVVLTYDIKNESQYNAQIGELVCTSEDAGVADYITLTPKNTLNGTTLNKETTSGKDTVEIEMIKSYAGSETENTKTYTFTCSMSVDAQES